MRGPANPSQADRAGGPCASWAGGLLGRRKGWCCWAVLLAALVPALSDELVGSNGERFVGRILEETQDRVLFESELGGRISIARDRIRELRRAENPAMTQTNPIPAIASSGSWTNAAWEPPGLGKDGFDWLQLKSGEWLKGRLKYVQDKTVQFESDELEELKLKLKDVRRLYSAKPMFAKFDDREQVVGTVMLSNDVVQVVGPEQVQVAREALQGITPGGKRELDFWSGNLAVGMNLQSGNSKQVSLNTSAELARRTPATQLLLNYLGNFGEVDGVQNANNQRANLNYDVRLNHDWFVRPAQLEYYRDQLANIAHRGTAGVGVGYYFFDRDSLEWKAAAGPSFQYTRYDTVAAGSEDHSSAPAATFQTRFKADITSRLTFIQVFGATLTSEPAGLYSHHAVTTLEFEIKRHLDLNLSFVWDYLQKPQPEADGLVPEHNDLRLSLGLGVRF